MKILVTGSSGFVGSALVKSLAENSHDVVCLLRKKISHNSPVWDPEKGVINLENVRDIDAVVHLAADNISEGRWDKKKKECIFNSRVNGTRLLAKYFSDLDHKPKVIVSASAIGFYGDRGENIMDETSNSGKGFLADVCKQWEESMTTAVDVGIRVVNVRLGVVLSNSGGALKKMLIPFNMGLGGIIGSGKQYMSWVSMDDVIGMIQYVIANDSVRGPVNLVSPHAVSNHEFTNTLGQVLHRPTILPMPVFVVRILFGEMGNELLLSSTRVVPKKLMNSGYVFCHSKLEEALKFYIR